MRRESPQAAVHLTRSAVHPPQAAAHLLRALHLPPPHLQPASEDMGTVMRAERDIQKREWQGDAWHLSELRKVHGDHAERIGGLLLDGLVNGLGEFLLDAVLCDVVAHLLDGSHRLRHE